MVVVVVVGGGCIDYDIMIQNKECGLERLEDIEERETQIRQRLFMYCKCDLLP